MREEYIHFLHERRESASDYPWSSILKEHDRSPASCLLYESMEKYRDGVGLLHGDRETIRDTEVSFHDVITLEPHESV